MTDTEYENSSPIKSLFELDRSDNEDGGDFAAGSFGDTQRPSVPVAKDGSRFDESCCRRGKYTVGEKGSEKSFISYSKALKYLRTMPVAKWLGPKQSGKWGIVSAVYWEGEELSSESPVAPLMQTGIQRPSKREKPATQSAVISTGSLSSRSQAGLWLKEFLERRQLNNGPDGRALYLYRTESAEYDALRRLLADAQPDIEHPVYGVHWSAAFCLYISETYRRDYRGDWSWKFFEQPLSLELSPPQHKDAVEKGLSYWQRRVKARESGESYYLGTLLDEGGLPWKLVQGEKHGFAIAIRAAIKEYYTSQRDRCDLISVVARYSGKFPGPFQTAEKYQLIALVAQWMVSLAEAHPIQGIEDPAAYLDQHAPEWRVRSPLPVGEENARRLLNEWLKDAGKAKAERAAIEADSRNYTCEHILLGDYSDWRISTRAFLPGEITIQLENCGIKSTRLEVAFYEGDSLLSRSGILHGQVNDERTSITAKIDHRTIALDRKQPDLPLIVRFLSNGDCIAEELCNVVNMDGYVPNDEGIIELHEGFQVYLCHSDYLPGGDAATFM